ncbi:hypothetical protein E2C01_062227 [Portunus trituberculatus]|uniref:Uncharacterized protein n=1 Tax=Portunus trituberculatus TaxID=210409 RepID=A0A5B7HFJ5_PORTR|nr:hypothetical protein [Portunus trituberculatus]
MLTFPSRVTQEHQVTSTRSTSPGDSYNSLKLTQEIISAKPNNLHYLFLKLRTIWLTGLSRKGCRGRPKYWYEVGAPHTKACTAAHPPCTAWFVPPTTV